MTGEVKKAQWARLTLVVCFLFNGTVTLALDKSRLWLPKKYHHLMPELIDAAQAAEQTSRCQWVIDGKINVRKSTAQHHYFVITCRDEQRHSYNLSYLAPVAGGDVSLYTEQGGYTTTSQQKNNPGPGESADTTPVLDAQTALEICHDAVSARTDSLDAVMISEDEIAAPGQPDGGFFYQFPFNKDSALGNKVRYRADCRVNARGEASVAVFLEAAGALVLCRDSLKEETLLMRHVKVQDEPLQQATTPAGGFSYTLGLSTKSRRGSPIHYSAQCQVAADGSNNVKLLLDKSGALAICKDTLRSEAIQLKGLSVIDEQVSEVVENDEGFFYWLPFEATIPGGDKGRYKASCQVDYEGVGDVSFNIDKAVVVPLCIDKLKAKTRTMIDVAIVNESDVPIVENAEGYISHIAFNAKSPMGKLLRYQAQCHINGIGVASVTIVPRTE